LLAHAGNLYTGTDNGGVFTSANNATSWSAFNTGMTTINVTSLAAVGNSLYAGTNGVGVYMTSISTGIETVAETEADFRVYPNPFSKNTQLSLNLPENAAVQIGVFNALGQKIQTVENSFLSAGSHLYAIGLETKGVYFVRTLINGKSTVQKIVQAD
jgi:hypothetical protein